MTEGPHEFVGVRVSKKALEENLAGIVARINLEDPTSHITIGPGLVSLVLEIDRMIEMIYPEYTIFRIIEHSGWITYDVNLHELSEELSNQILDVTSAFQVNAMHTCWECGHVGTRLSIKTGGARVLCSSCELVYKFFTDISTI